MGIYRCNKCGSVAEYPYQPGMASVACTKCGHANTVYDTVYFVQKLLERYFVAARELKALQEADNGEENTSAGDQENTGGLLMDVDIRNTNVFAKAEQHFPLASWLAQHNVQAEFDYSSVDMSGYFDEAAQSLGNLYTLTKDLLGRINWAYRNKHTGLNIDLGKLSQKDAQALNNLCRQFYNHSLFAGYFYQKQEKIIRLKLQRASKIEHFFSGAWLEWFALDQLLHQAKTKGSHYSFSCARSVKLSFANEDMHELDVAWLPHNKLPIVVECKSGEFRRDIEKYIRLKKRLNLPASHFVILVAELDDAQAAAMSSMYELSFLNMHNFIKHIDSLM